VSSDAEGAFVLLICKKDRLPETQALPNEAGSRFEALTKGKGRLGLSCLESWVTSERHEKTKYSSGMIRTP